MYVIGTKSNYWNKIYLLVATYFKTNVDKLYILFSESKVLILSWLKAFSADTQLYVLSPGKVIAYKFCVKMSDFYLLQGL